jgi:hypothetical protein
MTDWMNPQNFSEWFRRLLALRPILAVLLISGVTILELRFDWIERALGAYLVTTNAERPESGAIWEKGRQSLNARKTLEQIVTDRQASQREARNATSFKQIAANVASNQGVMLSSDHFRKLYLNLPREIAREILSPFELLRLASDGLWRRTYFKKAGEGLTVYLLDANNRVLKQLNIFPDLLPRLGHEEVASDGVLEDLPNFENRIYAAKHFFDALQTFPEEVRRTMVPHPESLLELPGQITRVGISDETGAGFIELGFEIVNASQHRLIVVQGQEWAVWRLRSLLEENRSGVEITPDAAGDRTSQ